jgi:glycerol-3-phosphate O-acyltransferase
MLASSGFLVAHRVLRSFVEAELVVAERLGQHGGDPLVDEKVFLAECAGVGQQMLLQGRVHSAEALSGELFGAALRLAEGRHLLVPEAGSGPAGDLGARRAAFAAQLDGVAGRIQLAAEIDAELTP